ncbi:MAG: glycoside hydrolase family 99-like domain-containing protein, partial [Planctomycetota bacterium]
PNNGDLRFAIMWCNHDVGAARGAVTPATFDMLVDYVSTTYFPHPSYWKIEGKPYFSIYDTNSFLKSFGNDLDAAAAALERFRERARAAGFPGLHLNAVLFGLPREARDEVIRRLGVDSTTSYVWIHHYGLPDFPATDYAKAAEGYFRGVEQGGGQHGLEQPAASLPVPYHPNVSMGWDSSPRCRNAPDWANRRGYPFGAVMVNNTPQAFRQALERAKPLAAANPPGQRIITINSWNEWSEGSYLEPDTVHGLGYLEAIRDVFPPARP